TASLAWSAGLAPEAEAVAALVAHRGVIRVDTLSELLDVGQILAACPLPAGSRDGVVGNAAALVQLAEATCVQAGLTATHSRWTLPGAPPRLLRSLVGIALGRDDVDMVLTVISPPMPGSTVDEAVDAVADAVEAHALAGPGGVIDGESPVPVPVQAPVAARLPAGPAVGVHGGGAGGRGPAGSGVRAAGGVRDLDAGHGRGVVRGGGGRGCGDAPLAAGGEGGRPAPADADRPGRGAA